MTGPPPANSRRPSLVLNALAGWGANIGKTAIQLVLLPVMAHLLGPAEFGLYALALPTINFLIVLADGGIGQSLAQESEDATVVWSTAFWILLASGFALGGLTAAWGVLLAHLSGQPSLAGIMLFLSVVFVPLTMAVIPSARLTRRGNLVAYSAGDLAASVLGGIVAVVTALMNWGAYALAAQYVVSMTVRAAALNIAAFRAPTRAFQPRLLLSHLAMGGALVGSRLAELVGRAVENLLVGRAFGTAGLGAYTFANQMPRFLCEAASNPLWATLYAHALHADRASTAALHQRFCRLLAMLLFPLTLLLSAAAPEVFALVLGPKWAAAATLTRIVAPFLALNAMAVTNTAVLMAAGRSATIFRVLGGTSLLRVAAVAIGVLQGPQSVAWGIGLAIGSASVVMFVTGFRQLGVPMATLARTLLPGLLSGLGGGLVCAALLAVVPESLAWTAGALAAGGLAALALLLLLEGARLKADYEAVRRMVSRRRNAPA